MQAGTLLAHIYHHDNRLEVFSLLPKNLMCLKTISISTKNMPMTQDVSPLLWAQTQLIPSVRSTVENMCGQCVWGSQQPEKGGRRVDPATASEPSGS